MKALFSNADGIPQFINTMEAAHQKSKRAKLVIHDKYMHNVALKSLLQSGEYATETREWSKLSEYQQTWTVWKTTFQEAYVAKRRLEATREGGENPFRNIWFCSRKDKECATTEERESNNSRVSPAQK